MYFDKAKQSFRVREVNISFNDNGRKRDKY